VAPTVSPLLLLCLNQQGCRYGAKPGTQIDIQTHRGEGGGNGKQTDGEL
jgi:hypothetical protein